MADAGRKPSLTAWVWVYISVLAVFELVAHPLIRAAVPLGASWEEAAAFVREEFRPGDRIVAAPSWTDPIVRFWLGDLESLRAAAPPDEGGFARMWELSIRAAGSRRDAPVLEREFGRVRVRLWELGGRRVVFDFVEEVQRAQVEVLEGGLAKPCRWVRGRPDPGGLERGPMWPAERFVCDDARPWLWVGPTIVADLELHPRRCIWQHPAGGEPVRTTFREVPLGERLVIHAGVDYQIERRRDHAPVTLTVSIEDEVVAQLVHRDGDGWSGLDVDTSSRANQHATVRFETTTPNPEARLFCFSASTQSGGDHG